MKKDVYIATGVGFILGAVVALAVVNLPNLIKKSREFSQTTEVTITPLPTQISQFVKLEITSPEDQIVSKTKDIDLIGQTVGEATVVIETDFESSVIAASSDGSFRHQLTLAEGGNNILLTAYDEKGESEAKTLTVFYTPEKL